MKLKHFVLARCVVAGLTFAACDKDDDDNSTTLNTADTNFMTQASISNTAEDSAGYCSNSQRK